MLRTHGRVASCQPAAALSVSCLVAVCLSFTHSTHSFGCPISPRLFRLSVSPPRPLFLSSVFFSFFSISLSLSLSLSLSPFFSVTGVQIRWPRYSNGRARICLRKYFFGASGRYPPRCPTKFMPDVAAPHDAMFARRKSLLSGDDIV